MCMPELKCCLKLVADYWQQANGDDRSHAEYHSFQSMAETCAASAAVTGIKRTLIAFYSFLHTTLFICTKVLFNFP